MMNIYYNMHPNNIMCFLKRSHEKKPRAPSTGETFKYKALTCDIISIAC